MKWIKYRNKYTGSACFRLPVYSFATGYMNKIFQRLIIFLIFIFLGYNPLYCNIRKTCDEFHLKLQFMKNSDTPQTSDAGELIVLFRADSDVVVDDSGKVVSRKGINTVQVNDLIKEYKAVIKSIGPAGEKNQGEKILHPEMRFFVIKGPENLESLRLKLLKTHIVDSAYIKPLAEDPDFQE